MRVLRFTPAATVLLFGANTTLGWRVSRRISRLEGERGVERGAFREVLDETSGALIGYQMIAEAEMAGDRDLPSLQSAASISDREMRMNAGELGPSRTAGLPEAKRLERAERRDEQTGQHLHLAPEDEIERAQMKVRVFPKLGAARGDILRVWPRTEAVPL